MCLQQCVARPGKCFALYSIAAACDNSRLKHDWVFEWIFKSEWQSRQDNSSTHTLFVLSSLWQFKRLRQSIHNQVSGIKPVSEVVVCLLFLPSLPIIVPDLPFARCSLLAVRCSLLDARCSSARAAGSHSPRRYSSSAKTRVNRGQELRQE